MNSVLFAQFRGPVGPVGGGGSGGGECIGGLICVVVVIALALAAITAFLRGIAQPLGADIGDLFAKYRAADTPTRGRLLIGTAVGLFVCFVLLFSLSAGISLLANNWKPAKSWVLDQVGLGWEWIPFQASTKEKPRADGGRLAAEPDGKRMLMLQSGRVIAMDEPGQPGTSYRNIGTVEGFVALANGRMVSIEAVESNGQRRHVLQFWRATYSSSPEGDYALSSRAAAWSGASNGKSLVVLLDSGRLVWIGDAADHSEHKTMPAEPAPQRPLRGAIAVLGRSSEIVLATPEGVVQVYAVNGDGVGKLLRERDLKAPLGLVATDAGGYEIAVSSGGASPGDTVHLLDAKTLQTKWSAPADGGLAFSRDGHELVNGARVHRVKDGSQLQDLRTVAGGVPASVRIGAAAFFKEGKALMLLGDDGQGYVFTR